jgi:hypothetical protein
VVTYSGPELKLFLAPKGQLSMWEGEVVIQDPHWLTCTETDLFEVPVAATE